MRLELFRGTSGPVYINPAHVVSVEPAENNSDRLDPSPGGTLIDTGQGMRWVAHPVAMVVARLTDREE